MVPSASRMRMASLASLTRSSNGKSEDGMKRSVEIIGADARPATRSAETETPRSVRGELDLHALESPGLRELVPPAGFDDVTVPDDEPLGGSLQHRADR